MAKKPQSSGLADGLGSAFAYLQHGMDRVIGWGFARMRDVKIDQQQREKRGVLGRLLRMGKGSVKFLGDAGDAYYRKYEDLKRRADGRSH